MLSSAASQFPLKLSEGGGAQLHRFSLQSSANSPLLVCVSPRNYSVTMAFAACLPRVSDLMACISLYPLQHLKEIVSLAILFFLWLFLVKAYTLALIVQQFPLAFLKNPQVSNICFS